MKAITGLGALILLLSIPALPALPTHCLKLFSSTKAFLIDGKRYLLEKAAGDDASLIRRELKRLGLDVTIPRTPQQECPYFQDAVRADNETVSSPSIPIPRGLLPEHDLQMESDSGPVELVVGSVDAHGPYARNRLPVSEWKPIETARGADPVFVAIRKKGKETFLAFVEEERGKFLIVRKPE